MVMTQNWRKRWRLVIPMPGRHLEAGAQRIASNAKWFYAAIHFGWDEATLVSSLRKKSKFGLGRLSVILLFLLAPLLGHGSTESVSSAAPEHRLRFYHTHTGE